MPVFVFNNILASFVLFRVFFATPVFPGAGTIALFLGVGSLSTTMCPQNDHNYRLPYVPGFVKRKMRRGAKEGLRKKTVGIWGLHSWVGYRRNWISRASRSTPGQVGGEQLRGACQGSVGQDSVGFEARGGGMGRARYACWTASTPSDTQSAISTRAKLSSWSQTVLPRGSP
jgi:hypothetical protein